MDDESAQLIAHIARSTNLPTQQAARVIADILEFYSESAEAFVARRHQELAQQGLKNPAIFDRISKELPARRFTSPSFSLRQLRRLIYG